MLPIVAEHSWIQLALSAFRIRMYVWGVSEAGCRSVILGCTLITKKLFRRSVSGLDNRVGLWESCGPLVGYMPVFLLSHDACRARLELCGALRSRNTRLWSGHMVPGGLESCYWPFVLSGCGVDPHGLNV